MQQMLDAPACVIGTRQVMRALEQRTLARAMLAQDADKALQDKLTAALEQAGVPLMDSLYERAGQAMRDQRRRCRGGHIETRVKSLRGVARDL